MAPPHRATPIQDMARSHAFGHACEDAAAHHLERAGWTLLARNFRCGHREIDIVARRGNLTAFVEVKGRSGPAFGHPFEAITALKRLEIERVARTWIALHPDHLARYRFDAIGVYADGVSGLRIEHLEDAWRPVR